MKTDKFKSIIVALIIITFSYGIAEYIHDILNEHKKIRVIYGQLALPAYYIIISLGIMMSLDNLGFSKTTLFTILGTIGLTLALSLQNIFTSLIAGIYIGLKSLYKIGDYLEVTDNAGRLRKGTIIDVDLFSTTILSEDMMRNEIPNTIIENTIVNIKHSKKDSIQ